jgi:hypothetical protein
MGYMIVPDCEQTIADALIPVVDYGLDLLT